MVTFSETEHAAEESRMKILAGKSDMLTHGPARFDLEGDPANPFLERRTIPRDSFLRMAAWAKERHATVNDLMLAAFLRALSRRFDRLRLSGRCRAGAARRAAAGAKGTCARPGIDTPPVLQ